MSRKPFPDDVETEVLTRCGRRCALCFGLNRDTTTKLGQIAHIDRNSENSSAANAAFLCAHHHVEYDSRSPQAKALTSDELKVHQADLYRWLASRRNSSKKPIKQLAGRTRGVSLEVHDRRMPVYRTTIQFIRDVMKDLKPELGLIFKFASDTDEALFLFDETVSGHLEKVFRQALELHTVGLMLSRLGTDEKTKSWSDTEITLAQWFSDQVQETRKIFTPFLRLA